jgi:hypothetical protein
MTTSGGQAYNPIERVDARRRAGDIARGACDAQAQAIIAQQGQQLLTAMQAASTSAIQLAEANAAVRMVEVNARNAI